jgi:hypothetical protein
MSDKLIDRVERIAYHRNGVGGEGFYVLAFRGTDRDDKGLKRDMVGVVFPEPGHVAVFDRDMLATGEIGFGVNSWRGDQYEPELRAALGTEAWA